MMPIDGDPDPKSRGPQETPDKPEPNDEVGGAAGRIKCGAEGRRPSPKKKGTIFLGGGVPEILRLSAENLDRSKSWGVPGGETV